jgi:hypothetical protein
MREAQHLHILGESCGERARLVYGSPNLSMHPTGYARG